MKWRFLIIVSIIGVYGCTEKKPPNSVPSQSEFSVEPDLDASDPSQLWWAWSEGRHCGGHGPTSSEAVKIAAQNCAEKALRFQRNMAEIKRQLAEKKPDAPR